MKPKNKKLTGISVKNVDTTKSRGELYIYGEISDDKWWGDEVTPDDVLQTLSELDGVKDIDVYVNSPGGGVFAGMAIYNILNRFSKNSTLIGHIDGVAASIAGVLIMVCDRIKMPANTLLMIHDPLIGLFGNYNIKDLEELIKVLKPVKETIVNVFEARMNLERDKIIELMEAETYITADIALEYGLIDEIGELKELKTETDPQNKNIKIVNGVGFDTDRIKKLSNFINDSSEETPEDHEEEQDTDEDPVTDEEPKEISYTEFENSINLMNNFLILEEGTDEMEPNHEKCC